MSKNVNQMTGEKTYYYYIRQKREYVINNADVDGRRLGGIFLKILLFRLA
jgi:hypothetical protein